MDPITGKGVLMVVTSVFSRVMSWFKKWAYNITEKEIDVKISVLEGFVSEDHFQELTFQDKNDFKAAYVSLIKNYNFNVGQIKRINKYIDILSAVFGVDQLEITMGKEPSKIGFLKSYNKSEKDKDIERKEEHKRIMLKLLQEKGDESLNELSGGDDLFKYYSTCNSCHKNYKRWKNNDIKVRQYCDNCGSYRQHSVSNLNPTEKKTSKNINDQD